MSYAFADLKPVKVPDPRIDIRPLKKYLFQQPANVVTYKEFTTGSHSDTSVSFTATPPNPNVIISPLVYIHTPATLSVNAVERHGADPANQRPRGILEFFLSSDKKIVPRQFPISSVIQTLSIKLNTDTTTVTLNDYIHALGRFYCDDAIRAYEMSACPMQPDFFQKYNDDLESVLIENGTANEKPETKGMKYGTNRSPFQAYGANTNESTRGSYKPKKVTYVNPTTTAEYEFDEPLFVSPLSSGKYTEMGLIQIQTFDLNITWDASKLTRMFSMNKVEIMNALRFGPDGNNYYYPDEATCFNPSVKLGSPTLKFIYMTPHINYPIPQQISYEFSDISRHTQDILVPVLGWNPGAPAADADNNGGKANITSNNIQLSSIPKKVYIFVRRNNDTRNHYTADAFARIRKISIDFNAMSGIMASASELDLWRMSCDNGARISWDAWRYYGGSVLCIDFGKNIGLSAQQAVGMLGTYNFSFNLEISNINTEDMNMQMFTIFESVGIMSIQDQKIIKQIGILSPNDVIDSDEIAQGDAKVIEAIHGGNFLTGVKNLYSSTRNFAKKAKDRGQKFAAENPELMNAAKTVGKMALKGAPLLLGLGYTEAQLKKMRAAGYTDKDFLKLAKTLNNGPVGRGGNALVGGNPVGGAMMSKKKLASRAYDY